MERLIQLDNLNRQEALRYLGSGGRLRMMRLWH